jgi:hypothetical protein
MAACNIVGSKPGTEPDGLYISWKLRGSLPFNHILTNESGTHQLKSILIFHSFI